MSSLIVTVLIGANCEGCPIIHHLSAKQVSSPHQIKALLKEAARGHLEATFGRGISVVDDSSDKVGTFVLKSISADSISVGTDRVMFIDAREAIEVLRVVERRSWWSTCNDTEHICYVAAADLGQLDAELSAIIPAPRGTIVNVKQNELAAALIAELIKFDRSKLRSVV